MFSRPSQRPRNLREKLAATDASLNNSQRIIDENRAMHPHNSIVQTNMDAAQEQLDRARDLQAIAYGQLERSENHLNRPPK